MSQATPNTACSAYRSEMVLLAMRRRLEKGDLSDEERQALLKEISRLEAEMDMD